MARGWVIVEPEAAGGRRLTGGYLYNARMAAEGGGRVAVGEGLDEVVVLDGLFLRDPGGFAARAARARAAGARVVALLHGLPSMFDRGAAGPSAEERAALRAVDAIVAPGPFLPALLGLPAAICPPGVDEAIAAVPPVPEARRRGATASLCVGTISPVKGQDVLLAALARFPGAARDGWRCDFVGEGDSLPAPPAVARRVRWRGGVPPERMPSFYAATDLVVLPSRSENAPLVVHEALAAGRPLIASDVGGVRAIVADAPAVTLVPPGDPAALAVALAAWWDERPSAEPRRPALSWAAAAARFVSALAA